MKKWIVVDQRRMADGNTISLHEHDGFYSILVGAVPLMSTRQHASEETLARLGCEHVRTKPHARVLIGGLGFGFTLRAALADLPVNGKIVVAEILESVITWNRNASLPLAAEAMGDPRVEVLHGDVRELIDSSEGAFDSIILDIDNGPAAITTASNDRVYGPRGLQSIRKALRAGGCAAFWSASGNAPFEDRMRHAGFGVTVHRARAHGNSGRHHTIFIGRTAR